ncbi:nicotinate-nucleotide adenylyltransferase, partial [Stenotrophomonas pictorum]
MAPSRLWLLYGGTFDPVHNGHLAIARCARDELASPVRLMPAADPPHRAPPGADAAQRAAMLELAIAGEPGLSVDLRELVRAKEHPGVPSWTVDTLRQLRAQIGASQPVALLIGADSLLGLPEWHEWERLLELAHLVVADRPGSPLEGGLP